MLGLIIFASIPSASSSLALANADPDQSVRMSNNGQFIAKNYPPRALMAREQGKVGFRLVVEPDGSLGSCEVTESSGSRALDKETCELLTLHARLAPVRNADGRAVRAVQMGYINWKLPKDAPKVASAAASTGRDPQRIICRKSETTGSLIKRTRMCLTSSQWAEQTRTSQERAEKAIGSGFIDAAKTHCPQMTVSMGC